MNYKIRIMGMSCSHCEENVKKSLSGYKEFKNVIVSHSNGILEYESQNDQSGLLKKIFKDSEYKVIPYTEKKIITYLTYALIVSVFLLLSKNIYNKFDVSSFSDSFTLISVLIFGLVTSFHCVGMCGGIALSQTKLESKKKNIRNSILYNIGRVLTYAFLGGVLGALGNVFTFSNTLRSILFFVIGIVMLLLGFNNLGLIKFNISKLNLKFPKKMQGKGSFVVGVMNGFMPCGPLQTVQILALSSASIVKGSLIMLTFGLGTIPLLFVFSNIGIFMKRHHHKQLVKVSALIVIMMSLMIFNQGFNSLGATFVDQETTGQPFAEIEDGYQIVNIYVNPNYSIEDVKVKKDIPVKLILTIESVSGCTANIMVPKYDVNTDLAPGIQELVFTPTESETLKITCWMSMVSTYLNVVD